IPFSHPRSPVRVHAVDAHGERMRRIRRMLADRGYQEAITYSFVDAGLQGLFDPTRAPLRLANSLSAETAVMRTSLWPGLSQVAQYNLNRQQSRVRIFEYGARYIPQDEGLKEENLLSGLAVGDAWPEQWGMPARAVDFHDVKGDLDALLAGLPG